MRLEEFQFGTKIYKTIGSKEIQVGALVVYQNRVIIGGRLKATDILTILHQYDEIVSKYDTKYLDNIHIRYLPSDYSIYITHIAGNKQQLIRHFRRLVKYYK